MWREWFSLDLIWRQISNSTLGAALRRVLRKAKWITAAENVLQSRRIMFWIRRRREGHREAFGHHCAAPLPSPAFPQIDAWVRISSSSLVFPKLSPEVKWQGCIRHTNYGRANTSRVVVLGRGAPGRGDENLSFQFHPEMFSLPHLLMRKSEPNEKHERVHTAHLSHLGVSRLIADFLTLYYPSSSSFLGNYCSRLESVSLLWVKLPEKLCCSGKDSLVNPGVAWFFFFFPQNRERRARSKALCFPLFWTSHRCFLLCFSSKSYSQMLNLCVSVVLMLEALLIKSWSQLRLNTSASQLLRRDQEGFPQKEKEMVWQQPGRMFCCILGRMWPSRFYLCEERNRPLPCPVLRGLGCAVGTPSNSMGGFPFPCLGDGSCARIWGLESHVLGWPERARVSAAALQWAGQARRCRAVGPIPSTRVAPSCREGSLAPCAMQVLVRHSGCRKWQNKMPHPVGARWRGFPPSVPTHLCFLPLWLWVWVSLGWRGCWVQWPPPVRPPGAWMGAWESSLPILCLARPTLGRG